MQVRSAKCKWSQKNINLLLITPYICFFATVVSSRKSTRNSTRDLSPELSSSPRRQRTVSSTDFKVPRGVQVVS